MLKEESKLTQIREFTQSDDFAVLNRFIEKNYLVAGLFENVVSCLKLYLAPVDFTKKEIEDAFGLMNYLERQVEAFKEILVKHPDSYLSEKEKEVYILGSLVECVFLSSLLEDDESAKFEAYLEAVLYFLVFNKGDTPDFKKIIEDIMKAQALMFAEIARFEDFAFGLEQSLRQNYGVEIKED